MSTILIVLLVLFLLGGAIPVTAGDARWPFDRVGK